MRALATALLLLLLPGLLLPAGLLLHICRCAEPISSQPAAACCTAAAPAVTAAAGRACCGHRAVAGEPDRHPQGPPSTRAADCGCVWVPLTDEQPEPNRPEPTPAVPMGQLPFAGLVLPPTPALAGRHSVHAARCRPPPDHQRSLPLRL